METLNKQWSSIPNWAKIITFIALPAAGFGVARFLDEYRSWFAMGPGGLPHNLRGFLTNLAMTALCAKKETKSLGVYDDAEKCAPDWKKASNEEQTKAKQSYLATSLPQRDGPESRALYFTAPQRERNSGEYFDPKLKQKYLQEYQSLGDEHADSIEWKTSVLEKRGQAMSLKEEYVMPTLSATCRREVLHIHESDMSAHVLLSLADAKEVISKGWGERHRVTGTVIPLGYTLLYIPRNEEEVGVLMKIFEAGIEYAKSNGKST